MEQQEHYEGHQLKNSSNGIIITSWGSLGGEQQEVWTKES